MVARILLLGEITRGPGVDSTGADFYLPYAAQDLFAEHSDEIGLQMVDFKHMVYVKEPKQYQAVDTVATGDTVLNLSGSDLRKRLNSGADIPEWFSFPAVVKQLRKSYPARQNQGFYRFL